MASDIYQQQSSPNGFSNYSFPGVLHYLQMEWRKFEKEKTEWEIEKTDLKVNIANYNIIICHSNLNIYTWIYNKKKTYN